MSSIDLVRFRTAFLASLVALVAAGTLALLSPSSPASASGATAVSAGGAHTCAVTPGGAVKCWGLNSYGELGNGSPILRSSTPVDVTGLVGPVVAVSAANGHTCALTGGAVMCWGRNELGQLGNGTLTHSSTPVPVVLGPVTGLSATSNHTCAWTPGGAVMCWGRNESGQLGNGTLTHSSIPVDVIGLPGLVAAVSAGRQHTCAVTMAVAVQCWGENFTGQLGNGTTTDSSTPVDVLGLGGPVDGVSAGGEHTCAVITGGAVQCWGSNGFGQLGNGTTTASSAPVNVVGLGGPVAAVSAGDGHTCAVTTGGAVQCWGANYVGQLGNGTATGPEMCGPSNCSRTPVNVTGLASGVAAVSAGNGHNCAVTTSGAVQCWGANLDGQLGNGTTTGPELCVGVNVCSTTPVDVTGLKSTDGDGDGLTDAFESGFGGNGIAIVNPETVTASATGSASGGATIISGSVTVTLPPGTQVLGGAPNAIQIGVGPGPEAAVLIGGASLPSGQTKTVEMRLGFGNAVCIDDRIVATIEGVLSGTCNDPPPTSGICPPSRIQIPVPASIGGFTSVPTRTPAPECVPTTYVVTRVAVDRVRVAGLVHSAVAVRGAQQPSLGGVAAYPELPGGGGGSWLIVACGAAVVSASSAVGLSLAWKRRRVTGG